jgi:hypothetical protein
MKRAAMLVAALCALLVVKVVYSFVPIPALLAVSYTAAGGASYASLAALAAGIGAALWSVDIKDETTGATAMRVRIAPDAPSRVPSGWTAAGNPANDPVPPGTAGSVTTYYLTSGNYGFNGGYTTQISVCQAYVASIANSQNTPHDAFISGKPGCRWYDSYPASATPPGSHALNGNDIAFLTQSVCPTGYALSGSVCTVSNPSIVASPPDLECGVKISGGVISYDSRDPDCTGTAPAGVVKAVDGKTLTVSGAKVQVKIEILTDGSVKITDWAPSTTDPTQTTVRQVGTTSPAAPSSPGTINGVQQSGVNAVGQPAFAVTPGGAQTQASPITFPDDYARENTAQTASTKLSDIKTALTDPGKAAADPAAKTPEEITAEFFPSTFSGLKAWAFPSRSVACPTWSFSVWSHSYTIDAHCALIESQRALFSAIMLLAWALVALFIVMGA